MNAPEYKKHAFLPDVQDSIDQRATAIQQVGVRGVRYPVWIRSEAGAMQPSVATWNLYVYLPETKKGTHMSRFIELLEQRQGTEAALDVAGFRAMLCAMTERLETHAGRIEVSYPFFISKAAPISGVSSLLDYEVRLAGDIEDGATRVTLTVQVPVTSLCPCSKEISQYGAHNQRSHVTMQVELLGDLSAEELVRMAEEEASSELYGLLKRPDEKYVTERAYENPKFVEDMVRDVVRRLEDEPRIGKFVVEVENFESIHNHSAYARVERN